MSPSDKKDITILYRFLRGLHCMTLVDLPFSKTLKEDLDRDFSLLCFYFPLFCDYF